MHCRAVAARRPCRSSSSTARRPARRRPPGRDRPGRRRCVWRTRESMRPKNLPEDGPAGRDPRYFRPASPGEQRRNGETERSGDAGPGGGSRRECAGAGETSGEAAREGRGGREEGAAEGGAVGHAAHGRRSAACPSPTPRRRARSSCATTRTSRGRRSATSPTSARTPGPASRRPITFSYNGGPGSSSIWLHMGVDGPAARRRRPTPRRRRRRRIRSSTTRTASLDKTDIVMIDPVGTGSQPRRRRGQGQGLLGRRSGHRVGRALHQAVRHATTTAGTRRSSCSARATAPRARRASSTGCRRTWGMAFNGVDPGLRRDRPRGDLRACRATTAPIRSSCRPTPRRRGTTRCCRTRRRTSSRG